MYVVYEIEDFTKVVIKFVVFVGYCIMLCGMEGEEYPEMYTAFVCRNVE